MSKSALWYSLLHSELKHLCDNQKTNCHFTVINLSKSCHANYRKRWPISSPISINVTKNVGVCRNSHGKVRTRQKWTKHKEWRAIRKEITALFHRLCFLLTLYNEVRILWFWSNRGNSKQTIMDSLFLNWTSNLFTRVVYKTFKVSLSTLYYNPVIHRYKEKKMIFFF